MLHQNTSILNNDQSRRPRTFCRSSILNPQLHPHHLSANLYCALDH